MWPGSVARWSQGLRQCQTCATWLELSNPHVIGALCGGVFAILLGGPIYLLFSGLSTLAILAAVLLIPVAWLLALAVARSLGEWRIVAPPGEESAETRKWNRVISRANFVVAAGAVLLVLGTDFVMLRILGLATLVVAAALAVVAQTMKNRARSRETHHMGR